MTLSKMTLGILTVSEVRLGWMTVSKMTFGILTIHQQLVK